MAMTRTFALLTGACILLTGTACSRATEEKADGGGGAATTQRDWASLKGFTAIEAAGPDDVVVTIGDTFAVTAQGDQRSIDQLDIRLEGDRLTIGRKRRSGGWGNWGDDDGATVRVTMPAIAAASLTGSGDFDLDRAEGKALGLALTGSGDMKVASVKTALLNADVTGSGSIALTGTAGEGRFSITGSGDIEAQGLRADKADARIMGSGNIGFASDGAVGIAIMGSGDVTVKGKAQCTTNVAGSGEAHCGA